VYPTIFEGDFITVYSYGLMLSIAIIVSTVLLLREAKKQGVAAEPLVDLILLVVLGGIIGARLFYVFFYDLSYFLTYPQEIFKFWQGGLVFYGGLIGGVVVAFWYLKRKRIAFLKTADLVAPFLALGYGIVRIGCFLNGCCYGQPTTAFWGIQFPVVDHLFRHPTQLYLSIMSFSIFIVLYYILRHRKFTGQVIVTYLILYSLGRALIEVFRENLMVLPFATIAQVVSLIIFAMGILIYFTLSSRLRTD